MLRVKSEEKKLTFYGAVNRSKQRCLAWREAKAGHDNLTLVAELS